MRARSCCAVERRHWIWHWTSDSELEDPATTPDTFSLDGPRSRMTPGSLVRDVPSLPVAGNLLGVSHLFHLNGRTTNGAEEIAATPPLVERLERGICTRREGRDAPTKSAQPRHGIAGNVSRCIASAPSLPGVPLWASRFAPADAEVDEDLPAFRLHSGHAVTRETVISSHDCLAQSHVLGAEDPAVTEGVRRVPVCAFEEGPTITGAQCALIFRFGDEPVRATATDRALLQRCQPRAGRLMADEASHG